MSNPFANKSEQYAKFRPVYPVELFDFISSHIEIKTNAWDCGTGNGQFAIQLASAFENVFATDISSEQLNNATPHIRIHYSQQPSEKTNFPDGFFNLITVAQAIHWFDFERFYREVNRTLKPDGVIAVIGYGLLNASPEVDAVIRAFYAFTDPYWDPQRKFLDEKYLTIPFPFDEIRTPPFAIHTNWSLDHLTGYLNTWSAVKHFIKSQCYNPVDELVPHLKHAWGEAEFKEITIPLFLRMGRKLANGD